MLELKNITHAFDGKEVLKSVDLTLAPGQRLALMGPSGVGKTTLLRIALGLIRPDSGTVANHFERPATVFQEPRLLPWRTAQENVNLVLGDRRPADPRALETLTSLGLADAAQKYPRELSGGMQQRVALARALAFDGDLLVLDEPFKALDADLRQRTMALVAQSPAAILLVTHDPAEAAALNCEIFQL